MYSLVGLRSPIQFDRSAFESSTTLEALEHGRGDMQALSNHDKALEPFFTNIYCSLLTPFELRLATIISKPLKLHIGARTRALTQDVPSLESILHLAHKHPRIVLSIFPIKPSFVYATLGPTSLRLVVNCVP